MSYCYEYPHPAVTTDAVLFTVKDSQLQVLLIKRAGEPYRDKWAFPGGFVEIDEHIDVCVARELAEETGVTGVYTEQLFTAGAPDRDPRERIISVTYLALVPDEPLSLQAASDAKDVAWFAVNDHPELAFDHDEIIAMARERLAAKLGYSTIALQLLPAKFTLSQLQHVYEVILEEKLDKRNFRKRLLASGCIEENGELATGGKHRPARIYKASSPGSVEYIK